MSYTKHPHALSGVLDVALAAKSVVEDPCLYETASLLLRLNELEQGGASSPISSPSPVKGIGLCKAVPIVRKIVWVRERPVTGVLIGVGIIGGIFAVGYLAGRKGKR